MMSCLRVPLAALALLSAATAIARADDYDTISQAMLTTLRAPSYHISMKMPDGTAIEGDVVNPGRMHMTMPMGESTIIGKTVYTKTNGVWKTADVPDLMPSPVEEMQKMAAARAETKVDDLGLRTADGRLMHAYKITNTKKNTVAVVFLDHAGRVAREEIDRTVTRMSKFGEPVSIKAPI